MPYVTERWLGGMLTNFATIRRSVKKMESIRKLLDDKNTTSLTKKERLLLGRQLQKLSMVLGGIENLNRVPAAVYVVDITYEDIAIKEAKKLGIRTLGMVDTNSNPNSIDFPIHPMTMRQTQFNLSHDTLQTLLLQDLRTVPR